jgi:hypothetical protein
MAKAVEQAARTTKPVRIGAAVSQFDKTHRHSFGPRWPPTAARGLPARRGRPRPQRRALRRHLRPGEPEAAGQPRQLLAAPRDARRQRPDLRGLHRADGAHRGPRDGGGHDLHPERRRHRRARAVELPLDPRAARVHPQGVRADGVRRAANGRRDQGHRGRRGDRARRRAARSLPRGRRGRSAGPLVPRARLAPVPHGLQLQPGEADPAERPGDPDVRERLRVLRGPEAAPGGGRRAAADDRAASSRPACRSRTASRRRPTALCRRT